MTLLLTILKHWLSVNALLAGSWCCWKMVQQSSEATAQRIEAARLARCRAGAARLERLSDYPAGFVIGTWANPIISQYEGKAYYARLEDLVPVVVEV